MSLSKITNGELLTQNGENVIDESYAEMIIIPNSKNDVFLCTYDVNYETGEYKTKALNSKNEEIFTEYEQIEAIANLDENNNISYADVLKVKKDGKYGLINLTGKELTAFDYDEITAISGVKNTIKVKKDGKIGIVNIEGKEILKPEYADADCLGTDDKSGFIVKSEDAKYGVVDYSGNVVLEAVYDEIEKIYKNDYYVVKKSGKEILVQKGGTEVLNTGYDEIKQVLKNAEHGIIYVKNNKYGVMKTTGEVTIEAEYDDLKEAKTGIFIAKQNDKYGVIDLEKNAKVEFKYSSINYDEKADIYIAEDESFNNEILDNAFTVKQSGILVDIDNEKGYIELRQEDEYKYYNFKFEQKDIKEIFTSNTLYLNKQNGKYGFVDKTGKVIVDYIYDDATEQNIYGYAAVKKDGKWGSIDNKGNVTQEPTYNLDDYLKINFIGRWHLGKDINMNYYNQI